MSKRIRPSIGAMLALCTVLLGFGSAGSHAQGMPVQRVDMVPTSNLALAADAGSQLSSQPVSSDGRYVVFLSAATNLVAGDDNGRVDLFLRDGVANTLTRTDLWRGDLGLTENSYFVPPLISGDGRWAFFSIGEFQGYIPGPHEPPPPESYPRLFRLDAASGEIEHMDWPGEASLTLLELSHDGRYLLARSQRELVPGYSAGTDQFYRLDLELRQIRPIQVSAEGQPALSARYAGLSSNGRYACYVDAAWRVLLRDLEGDDPPLHVDLPADGSPGPQAVGACRPSDDGLRVAFISQFPLNPYASSVSLWQRSLGHAQLVEPPEQPGFVGNLHMSRDGRVLAFTRREVSHPTSLETLVRWTASEGVSHWIAPRQVDTGRWTSLALSDDGQHLLLNTYEDPPGAPAPGSGLGLQIFLVGPAGQGLQRISAAVGDPLPSGIDSRGQGASFCSLRPQLSHDGRFALFRTNDARAHSGGPSNRDQVVLRDLVSGENELISRDALGRALERGAYGASISANGRFVVFSSNDEALGETDLSEQVFLHDRQDGSTRLISRTPAGEPGTGSSTCAVVNGDGTRVAFLSYTNNLAGPNVDQVSALLLWRAETDSLEPISRTLQGALARGGTPSISVDGRRVAFASDHNDLVENDLNPLSDIFLWQDGQPGLQRLSQPEGQESPAESRDPWLSGDGRFVIFMSTSPDFGREWGAEGDNVFIRDIDHGGFQWLNALPSQDPSVTSRQRVPASHPSISHDGSRVSIHVATNHWANVYRHSWGPALMLVEREGARTWRADLNVPPATIPLTASPTYASPGTVSGDGRHLLFGVRHLPHGHALMRAGPPSLHTAMWWDPRESGWGLASFDQGNAIAPIWYTNDEQGRPTWYLVPGLQRDALGDLRGPLLRFTGRPFHAAVGPPAQSEAVGEASLEFFGEDSLAFRFDIGEVQGERMLERFALPEQIVCSDAGDADRSDLGNFTDIWYAGPQDSGWGLQVFHAGQTLALAWYTYDPDSRAVYFIGATQRQADGRFTGTLFRPRDGLPLAAIDGLPASDGADPIGEVELRFADGERGEFRFRIDGVERSHAIQRLRFGSAASACSSRHWP
jgi:Tol biopolymer transport system component